jgi:hypothetical protein
MIFSHSGTLSLYEKYGLSDLLKRKAEQEIAVRILVGMDYVIKEKVRELLMGY